MRPVGVGLTSLASSHSAEGRYWISRRAVGFAVRNNFRIARENRPCALP